MAHEVGATISLDEIVARIKAARAEAQGLTADLQKAASAYGAGPQHLGTGAPSYVAGGNVGGVSGSASSNGTAAAPAAATSAQAGVSRQMAEEYRRYPGLSPAAYAQIAQALGVPAAGAGPAVGATPNLNLNAAAVGIIQSAQGRSSNFQSFINSIGAGVDHSAQFQFGINQIQAQAAVAAGNASWINQNPGFGGYDQKWQGRTWGATGWAPAGWTSAGAFDPNARTSFAAAGGFDPNKTISWNTAGVNQQRLQQTIERNEFIQRRNMALGLGGALAIGQGFSLAAESTVSGHANPMGWGGLTGGVIGGAIGFGLGGGAGMAVGAMLGGGIGSFMGAPYQRGYDIASSFTPGVGLIGNTHGGMMGQLDTWANSTAGQLNRMPRTQGMQNVTAASLGAGYSTMVAALLGSGIDPNLYSGEGMPGVPGTAGTPGRPISVSGGYNRNYGNVGDSTSIGVPRYRTTPGYGYTWAPTKIDWGTPGTPGTPAIPPAGDETLPQAISRRIHTQYPDDKTAQQVIGTIAPIWHSVPYHQMNPADIISRYGTAAYQQFRQSRSDIPSGMSLKDAADFEARLQSTQRMIDMGGLQTRGSGAAVAGGYAARMNAILAVPGGRDSVAYAQAFAGRREAIHTAFDQETAAGYGVASSNLQTQREIANSSPFAPGNRFAISLGIMGTNRAQMGRISRYYAGRVANGELSEDEQLGLTNQYNSLRASNAHELAALSEGVENRLPALFAGRSAGFRRFDSLQMASLNAPWYVRGYGSMGGRQARGQDDFVRSFDAGPIGPRSRSEFMNPAGGGGGTDNGLLREIVGELRKLNSNTRSGGGGGSLPPAGGPTRSGNSTTFN